MDVGKLGRTIGRALSLPTRIAGHPTVFSMLLLIGIFNGLVNMILSSLGSVYQNRYHFPATTAGLSYLGIGVGGLSALAVTKMAKRYLASKASSRGIADGPESALLFMMAVPPITTIGLVWYGWTVQANAFWILPIIGLFFFGFGYMSTRVSPAVISNVEGIDGLTLCPALDPNFPCRSRAKLCGLSISSAHRGIICRWSNHTPFYIPSI